MESLQLKRNEKFMTSQNFLFPVQKICSSPLNLTKNFLFIFPEESDDFLVTSSHFLRFNRLKR